MTRNTVVWLSSLSRSNDDTFDSRIPFVTSAMLPGLSDGDTAEFAAHSL